MKTSRPRIGILTGGGDCPGLNAVIRAVVKAASMRGWDAIGFKGGFEGLLRPVQSMELDYGNMGALLVQGGTILGTSNRGRFSAKTGAGETRRIAEDIVREAKANVESLGLIGLVCVGGDGSLTIAQQLFEAGVPVVGVPKTIDNDLEATVITFGFDSAVCCATDALDRLHTTAESHNRVMVLEVMGRHAGWIAVSAGISGGGDVILIPEIPFRWESVCAAIARREKAGKRFTLVVAAEIEKRTGKETRVRVLGHLPRGGGPTSFDRPLCPRFGARAVELVAEKKFGHMVALRPPDTISVPITQAVGKLKRVPVDGDLIRTGRALGISFGD